MVQGEGVETDESTSDWSTQDVTGGNRSVGPTYMDGRRRICSNGVLRLYVSSRLLVEASCGGSVERYL